MTSDALTAADFSAFFHELHGKEPFPWQQRLADEVVGKGRWPDTIALPTAAGKTACLDVAVFALACDAAKAQGERRAAMRVFFVVDRRVVVDEAYERARHVAAKLREARTPTVAHVAERLRHFTGNDRGAPLRVSIMRGGMYRDATWARDPAQPTVCVSTVDQVGSRLLFRGYGLSSGDCNTRPIHAGLVGNDALILLDEAHVSRPFQETLQAIEVLRAMAVEGPALPWQAVSMTATPTSERRFEAQAEDLTHPVLGPRLSARKLARLIKVEVPSGEGADPRVVEERARARFVAETSGQVLALLAGAGKPRSVGVVVNRVASARAIFEALRDTDEGDPLRPEVHLLTGRSRPLDRDALVQQIQRTVGAGVPRDQRDASQRPLVVVATQCIEVGANLDFEALVTEVASLDALRQRFGRLDRLGEAGTSHAVIVARADQVRDSYEDPVYGRALAPVWRWLDAGARAPAADSAKKGTKKKADAKAERAVDMGVSAVRERMPVGADLTLLCAPERHAPVMLPGHMDLWSQTSPAPSLDPDVAIFLHGPASGPADVQVVWRADLASIDESAAAVVALCPPSSSEALPLPFHVVREWLNKRLDRAQDFADVEGATEPEERKDADEGLHALRWRGPELSEVIDATRLRPGDTLVVPASYGGVDVYGWNPASKKAVEDLGDIATLRQRGIALLRSHPALLAQWRSGAEDDYGPALRRPADESVSWFYEQRDKVRATLERVADDEAINSRVRVIARVLSSESSRKPMLRARPVPYPGKDPTDAVWLARRPLSIKELTEFIGADEALDEPSSGLADDDSSASFTTPYPLSKHCRGVQSFAEVFARRTRLSEEFRDDLAFSGWLHDIGKADPRFQVMLHGGDEFAALVATELLAKSGIDPRDREAFRVARECSGYPRGARHEALSLAMIRGDETLLRGARDRELVMHLVASHHGCARPFMPYAYDPRPVEVELDHGGHVLRASSAHGLESLDSGVSERFWRLTRRFGWYGLAYLEAVLRLADHRESEREQRNEGEPAREGSDE